MQLNEGAVERIRVMEGPLSVACIVGPQRTGKSLLMNRILLNRNEGFRVGSSVKSCTKGIWMWNQPLKAHYQNRQVNLLVMDCEGLDSIERSESFDVQLFSLVVVMSSLLIYNSRGVVDEE